MLKYAKLLAGPLIGALFYWLLSRSGETSPEACRVGMLAAWMAVWWIIEAIPIELTALLPILYIPLAGIHEKDAMLKACAPYAHPSVFFFLGGFALGVAIEKTELHRRGALILLSFAGSKASTVVGAFMLCTAMISMWVNNTATTMLMLPLATSVLATQPDKRFAASLLIGIAYAASIGGMGTLVGTAPNIFFTGFMKDQGITVLFGNWMLLVMPLVVFMLIGCWAWLVWVLWPMKDLQVEVPDAWRSELAAKTKLNPHQCWTLVIFAVAALMWLLRDPLTLWFEDSPFGKVIDLVDDTWIAMGALFCLLMLPISNPVLTWRDIEGIPWGVLLLLGGGVSLSIAIKDSGLDKTIALWATSLSWMSAWAILTIVVIGVVIISELASNVATATAVLPILSTAADGLGIDKTTLLVATILACSCGFMLPVATPPNTLVFAQRRFTTRDMISAGAAVNLMAIIAIPPLVLWLKPLIHLTN